MLIDRLDLAAVLPTIYRSRIWAPAAIQAVASWGYRRDSPYANDQHVFENIPANLLHVDRSPGGRYIDHQTAIDGDADAMVGNQRVSWRSPYDVIIEAVEYGEIVSQPNVE